MCKSNFTTKQMTPPPAPPVHALMYRHAKRRMVSTRRWIRQKKWPLGMATAMAQDVSSGFFANAPPSCSADHHHHHTFVDSLSDIVVHTTHIFILYFIFILNRGA